MTRLTNAMRETIVDRAAAKSGLPDKLAAVKEKQFDWAERLRVFLLGGPEKAAYYAGLNADSQRLYGELPKGLREAHFSVNRESQMYVNLAGANLRVHLRGYAEAFDNQQAVEACNPLVQEFYDLETERKAAESAVFTLRQQVRATVDSFTTIATLLKAWPEAAELVEGLAPEPKAQFPAICAEQLNSLVGLPSTSK